jgi:ferritin-like metal-binding protein YciE
MKLNTLRDLYVEELKDIYSAEKQILVALPKLIEGAELPELKEAFEDHLAQTEEHVTRLETIFKGLDASPKGKKCKGMEGLLEEGSELLEENDEGSIVLDAGLIGAAQRVEHYEMAAYGTARAHAHELGLDDDADLLQQTLDEEEAADMRLTEIAEQAANVRASSGDESEDDDDSDDDMVDEEEESEVAVTAGSAGARANGGTKSPSKTGTKAKGATKSAAAKRANGNRTSTPVAAKRK